MKIINLTYKSKSLLAIDQIVEGCKRNDPQSQKLLFVKCSPSIMTLCRRYAMTDFGPSDILQETFITVFQKIQQYDSSRGSVENWIKKIAVNTALKVIRNKKIKLSESDSKLEQLKSDENDLPLSINRELLMQCISELPLGYRTVFNLFVIDDYSHKAISEKLNISVQTSKSQLSKAKRMLRNKLSFSDGSLIRKINHK